MALGPGGQPPAKVRDQRFVRNRVPTVFTPWQPLWPTACDENLSGQADARPPQSCRQADDTTLSAAEILDRIKVAIEERRTRSCAVPSRGADPAAAGPDHPGCPGVPTRGTPSRRAIVDPGSTSTKPSSCWTTNTWVPCRGSSTTTHPSSLAVTGRNLAEEIDQVVRTFARS